MNVFDSIIMGIIEGFTEFLPVSSTGHLIVTGKFLGVGQDSVTKAFEVIIQFAAILAVVINYPSKFSFKHFWLWVKIFVAFLPIALVGLIFSTQVKALFTVQVVATMFIVGGVIFLIVERFYDESRHTTGDVEEVTFKQALYIGIAQVFALVPGTSRAGSTIVGAMLSGLNRKASAEFSFLLAFPVMCAVTGYDLLKHHEELFTGVNFTNLAVGFVVSFIVAALTIKFFIKFLQSFTFVPFGIYRILLGVILFLIV